MYSIDAALTVLQLRVEVPTAFSFFSKASRGHLPARASCARRYILELCYLALLFTAIGTGILLGNTGLGTSYGHLQSTSDSLQTAGQSTSYVESQLESHHKLRDATC